MKWWEDPQQHPFKGCREDAGCPVCDLCGKYPSDHAKSKSEFKRLTIQEKKE